MLQGNEELPDGLPAIEPAPEPEQGLPSPEPAPLPDTVEIRNRDYEGEVDKAQFEAIAQSLNLDPDKLRQAIQIGLDGTRLYEGIREERARIQAEREAWDSQRLAAMNNQTAPGYQYPGQPYGQPSPAPYQGPQARVPVQRPNPNDVIGTVNWLADRMEALAPAIGRIPELDQMLQGTASQIQEAELRRIEVEERAAGTAAYNDVADYWKKQGLTLPPQERLAEALRAIPLSDDVEMSWHDVWDKIGWMVAGADNYRRARRHAMLDATRPNPTVRTPVSAAPQGVPRPTGQPGTIEDQIAQMESQLSGFTVGQTILPQGQ